MEELKQNTKYQILTPTGYQSFNGVRKLSKNRFIKFVFSNNNEIKCSENHKFIKDNKEIYAHNLNINDYVDGKIDKKIYIKEKTIINDKIDLYDIVNVNNGNLFYVNGVLSHNCDVTFLKSGRGVFNGLVIQHYKDNKIEKPKEKRRNNKDLWIFKYPKEKREYILSADVARGDGSDYSAFHVLDSETLEQMAEFKGKIDTREYGNLLVAIATEYNDALLVIENASMGWDVIQTAIERDYKNLYYSHKKDILLADVDDFIKKGYDLKQKEDMVAGFTTSTKSRPLIINAMKKLVNKKEAIIKSERLTNEMDTFIYTERGKPTAESGFNDDLILSFAIGIWVRDIALRLASEGKLYNRQSLRNVSKSLMKSVHKQNSRKEAEDYWIQKDPRHKKEEYDLKQWI